jgi:hypothetical protein
MAKTSDDAERFNRIVMWSLAITAVLLLILPMFFVLSNETYYSAYVEGGGYGCRKIRSAFKHA